MENLEEYYKRSGFTKEGYKCGKCGKNPLPEVHEFGIVKAKIILCPYCNCPIQNKIADKR